MTSEPLPSRVVGILEFCDEQEFSSAGWFKKILVPLGADVAVGGGGASADWQSAGLAYFGIRDPDAWRNSSYGPNTEMRFASFLCLLHGENTTSSNGKELQAQTTDGFLSPRELRLPRKPDPAFVARRGLVSETLRRCGVPSVLRVLVASYLPAWIVLVRRPREEWVNVGSHWVAAEKTMDVAGWYAELLAACGPRLTDIDRAAGRDDIKLACTGATTVLIDLEVFLTGLKTTGWQKHLTQRVSVTWHKTLFSNEYVVGLDIVNTYAD